MSRPGELSPLALNSPRLRRHSLARLEELRRLGQVLAQLDLRRRVRQHVLQAHEDVVQLVGREAAQIAQLATDLRNGRGLGPSTSG